MRVSKKAVVILLLTLSFFCIVLLHAIEKRGIGVIAVKSRNGTVRNHKVYDNIYGLVIGVNRFVNLPYNKQLKNCVRDAKGVRNVLRKQYRFQRIDELYNRDATKQGILSWFHRMKRRIKKNDALFVFIATHGVSEDNIGYIVPYDGSLTKVFKNISMVELRDVLGKIIKAKHIFYVVDACYSGSIIQTRSGASKNDASFEYIRDIARERVRYALTAGAKGQEVLDGGPNGHSVFTGRFIEALKNADGFITGSELSAKISRKVFSDARDRRHKQTPQYGRLSGRGDFVLIKKGDKRLDSVAASIKRIQQEKRWLEQKMKNARDRKVRERARIELQRKLAEERRKKLELDQIKEQSRRKATERTHMQKLEQEYRKNRQKAQADLERIKRQVAAKRRQAEQLGVLGSDPQLFINQILKIRKTIKSITHSYDKTRNFSINKIKNYYRRRYRQAYRMRQGTFESYSEYKRRKMLELDMLRKNEDNELRKVRLRYKVEKKRALTGLHKKISSLQKNNIFSVPRTKVSLRFSRFNRWRLAFPITVYCSVPGFRYKKIFYRKLMAKNSLERRRRGMRILAKIKANAYIAELKYRLNVRTLRGKFCSLRIIDITDNNSAFFENSIDKPAFDKAVAFRGNVDAKIRQFQQFRKQYPKGMYWQEAGKRISFWQLQKKQSKHFLQLTKHTLFMLQKKQMAAANMVHVKGGWFKFGYAVDYENRNNRSRRLHVSSFWIGKYEVTQAEFKQVMGYNASDYKGDNMPVDRVSWNDAIEYCNKRSKLEGLIPCYNINGSIVRCDWTANGYRLPTDAEWEYAAKGGQAGVNNIFKYAGGNDLDDVAWFAYNSYHVSGGLGEYRPSPVGEKDPNQLGLYDMTGNVDEWCWGNYGYNTTASGYNPRGPLYGNYRISRGGCASASASDISLVNSSGASPSFRYRLHGFRVVRCP